MVIQTKKFSTFQNGDDLEVNDITVGLRNGLNTRFTYTGNFPVGFIVPVAQGGTGANNAADARTNLGLGTLAVQNANAVAITGGTAALASGSVTAVPTSATDIANKAYVDERTDLHFMEAVQAASTGNFTSTYDNGTAGLGATLTATSNGAFTLDGQAGVLDARYLIKNQTNTFENGIYDLTQVGDGSNPAILTRSDDFNQASQIDPGDIVPVLNGTVNGSTAWIQTATVNIIGTDPIVFSQFIANLSNIVTIDGTQTITGSKTFNAEQFFSAKLTHAGDTDTFFEFGTDIIDLQTGGASRLDISDSGVRLGGANSRVTTILDEDDMASNSATALATQQSIRQFQKFTLFDSSIPVSVPFVDITGFSSDFFAYSFVFDDFLPVNDGVNLFIRMSIDNGATFISTASYTYKITYFQGTSLLNNGSVTGTAFVLNIDTGNAAGEGLNGELLLINPSETNYTALRTNFGHRSSTEHFTNTITLGNFNSSQAHNAARLQFTGGDIASGRLRVYGLKA